MNSNLTNIFKGDKVIWMIFFFLCIISVIEVYSASSRLTYGVDAYWTPILKHIGILFMGVLSMLVVLNVKCKYFKLVTPVLLPFAFITLIWALVGGENKNDASRWVSMMGISFQPSEIAKGAIILATAQILSAMQTAKGADSKAIKYILIVLAFIVIPIMVENLSTAVLIVVTVILMMFIGRVPMRQLGKLLGVLAIMGVLAVSSILIVGKRDNTVKNSDKQNLTEEVKKEKKENSIEKILHRADTWKGRIYDFFDNEYIPPEKFDLDENAQVGHANIAIASSKGIGKGPGNSTERDFLTHAVSDFIYAIIVEEMGLIGAIVVAALYIMLLFRAGRIASRCENAFPAFLIMGLAIMLVMQALMNMLGAVGLAPVTGQPLPLVSKGGSSSVINCIFIGVMLSISRSAKKNDAIPSANHGYMQIME